MVQCSAAPMCRMRTYFPGACQEATLSDEYCTDCTHGEVRTVNFRWSLASRRKWGKDRCNQAQATPCHSTKCSI